MNSLLRTTSLGGDTRIVHSEVLSPELLTDGKQGSVLHSLLTGPPTSTFRVLVADRGRRWESEPRLFSTFGLLAPGPSPGSASKVL